jgi:hypothetical protein
MTAQSESRVHTAGEYVVTNERSGQGIDYYLRVVGPDGRETEQKVYWTYSMTPHQVAEAAVAGHVGFDGTLPKHTPTREGATGGYVVTLG